MNLDFLVPYETITNAEDLFIKVDRFGEIVILKNNQPAYKILKVGSQAEIQSSQSQHTRLDLWEAMDVVLSEKPDKTMHASDIASEITARELYFMKNGSAVSYNQIRARAGHKPQYFECLKGNYIRLIERYKKT